MKKLLFLIFSMTIMCFYMIGCTEEDPLANVEVEKANEKTEYVLPNEKQ